MSDKLIVFVNRYQLPQYHSIEQLFINIQAGIGDEFHTDWLNLPAPGASLKSIWKNLFFLKPKKDRIYHITGDVNYIAIRLGKRAILTVHDIQSAIQGNWIKRLIISYLWFKIPAKRVKYITVISEFTAKELGELIPKQAHKIRVIPNPVNPFFQYCPERKKNKGIPKILCIGTKSNKNLEGSIQAVRGLDVELVIIGKLSPYQIQLLENNKCQYRSLGNVSMEEVYQSYQECYMLCFPSFYEGFGMPILEAQAVGRPVLTSNLGAMKDVAGDAACLANPSDILSIRSGIISLLEQKSYRAELIRAGLENVKRFDRKRIIDEYKRLYTDSLE